MFITSSDFLNIIKKDYFLIDVRSELEFKKSHLPGSCNIPILNDEHRILVGTCYKQRGKEQALKLGHELVSGKYRGELIEKWQQALIQNQERVPALLCWRGGMRSGIAQNWLTDAGVKISRIEGGYKAFRNFTLAQAQVFFEAKKSIVISGMTGSGKTDFLNETDSPTLDLENLSNHRGSAFGNRNTPQPTQSQFENDLAWTIIKQTSENITIEDESRMIGSIVLPDYIFNKIRSSPVVTIEASVDERVDSIYRDYILDSGILASDKNLRLSVINRYRTAFQNISKKLGDERYRNCLELFQKALVEFEQDKESSTHRDWIKLILVDYYDPLYLKSFEKRKPLVLFKGTRQQVLDFFKTKTKNY